MTRLRMWMENSPGWIYCVDRKCHLCWLFVSFRCLCFCGHFRPSSPLVFFFHLFRKRILGSVAQAFVNWMPLLSSFVPVIAIRAFNETSSSDSNLAPSLAWFISYPPSIATTHYQCKCKYPHFVSLQPWFLAPKWFALHKCLYQKSVVHFKAGLLLASWGYLTLYDLRQRLS